MSKYKGKCTKNLRVNVHCTKGKCITAKWDCLEMCLYGVWGCLAVKDGRFLDKNTGVRRYRKSIGIGFKKIWDRKKYWYHKKMV